MPNNTDKEDYYEMYVKDQVRRVKPEFTKEEVRSVNKTIEKLYFLGFFAFLLLTMRYIAKKNERPRRPVVLENI